MNGIGRLCVFLLTLMFAAPSSAQSGWPGGPISIVVPYAAGGITDTLARIVAERLSACLGVSVIADNRAGAGGVIASAPPVIIGMIFQRALVRGLVQGGVKE